MFTFPQSDDFYTGPNKRISAQTKSAAIKLEKGWWRRGDGYETSLEWEKKNQQNTPHDYNEIHHKEEKI